MAFTFGLGGLLIFPFRFGAATSLVERFSTQEFVDNIRETRVTILFCSATTYNMLLKADLPGLSESCRTLRLCVSAGETLPAAILREWKQKVGTEVLTGSAAPRCCISLFPANPAR